MFSRNCKDCKLGNVPASTACNDPVAGFYHAKQLKQVSLTKQVFFAREPALPGCHFFKRKGRTKGVDVTGKSSRNSYTMWKLGELEVSLDAMTSRLEALETHLDGYGVVPLHGSGTTNTKNWCLEWKCVWQVMFPSLSAWFCFPGRISWCPC